MAENGTERLTKRKIETRTLQEFIRRSQVEYIKTGFMETQIKNNIVQDNENAIPQKDNDEKPKD